MITYHYISMWMTVLGRVHILLYNVFISSILRIWSLPVKYASKSLCSHSIEPCEIIVWKWSFHLFRRGNVNNSPKYKTIEYIYHTFKSCPRWTVISFHLNYILNFSLNMCQYTIYCLALSSFRTWSDSLFWSTTAQMTIPGQENSAVYRERKKIFRHHTGKYN
jgi:hypothetical protein